MVKRNHNGATVVIAMYEIFPQSSLGGMVVEASSIAPVNDQSAAARMMKNR